MKKRSEIKSKKTEQEIPTKVLCGVGPDDKDFCGIELELRDVEGKAEKQYFCTAHGYVDVFQVQPKEDIAKLSADVNKVIDEAEEKDRQERLEAVRHSGNHPAEWPSANRAHEKPLDERFSRIQEHAFVDDVEGTWQKLEEQLRVGEDRSDRGVLLRALDNAETNARLAHRLWMTGKYEQTRYETTNKIVFGAMRDAATKVLQKEKDQKLRSKQITEEDVETMSALLFPDEYEAQTLRRRKVELMVKSLENLNELWLKRCSALETMLGKSR